MFLDNEKSLCKKCVPEYIEENMKLQRKALAEDPDQQINAGRMAGINNMALNAYQTEKSQISRSLDNVAKFNKELRYMQDGIKETEIDSNRFLRELPTLLNALFDKLEQDAELGE